MACEVDDSESLGTGDFVPEAPAASPDEKKPIPRRNLSEAFEALCVDTHSPPDETSKLQQPFFSPTSVTQPIDPQTPSAPDKPYEFNLHRDLMRDLSPALISRVSLYAVIHDINKEALAIATNDPLIKEDKLEEASPLVHAVTGSEVAKPEIEVKNAMIDEESWLLEAIANRTRDGSLQTIQACPPTFLQAMGEKEYENPVHALSGASRTQLWKPSRSWWEAKSGKNPWIEPNSHNKRWRYLWPFIHYHKFLAKCIKKLKRNGADVKHSVSPVAVFLREEVCAVSDHLAAVSLFGSEEWMNCLQHFHGWTADDAEDVLLAHVRHLKLRPLNEPGDVDSPLLRSQIDEHFLKAMAVQREQLREIPSTIEAPKKVKSQLIAYPKATSITAAPAPAASTVAVAAAPSPAINTVHSSSGVRRPRYPQQQPQYWPGAVYPDQQRMVYGDNSSVQSGISTESGFAMQYPEFATHNPHMVPSHHYSPYYIGPHMYGTVSSQHHPHDLYHNMVPPQQHPGWIDPSLVAYGMQSYFADAAVVTPSSPHETINEVEKEEKEDHTSDVTPQLKINPQHSPPHQGYSPFWSHLVDGAAQSLVTPAKSPSTPNRAPRTKTAAVDDADRVAAQPLLLRGYPYGYSHYGARDGYAPPSPATQFMMPPTQNYTFYYGGLYPSSSPGRAFLKSPKPPTPGRKGNVTESTSNAEPVILPVSANNP